MAIAGAAGATIWQRYLADSLISREELATLLVHKGDLAIPVSASGIFVVKEQKLLTSPSSGTVEEILAAPGAMVKKGEIILRLNNSRLVEQKSACKAAQEKADLDLKEAELSEKIDAVAESSKHRALTQQLALEQQERDAIRPLTERGIISKLEMARANAKVDSLQAQIADQKNKIALTRDLSRSRVAIKLEALKQARENLASAQRDLDDLLVRSSVDGPVQDVFVVLGQSVASGEKLAQVSNSDALVATLKIPQNKAPSVAWGNVATLQVQGKPVRGTVVRIDPKVRDDSVLVYIEPSEPLPAGVRAAESITGDIEGAPASEAVYVERRDDIQPFKEREVFLLSGNELRRHRVQFGAASAKYVEVLSGLHPGDRFAIGLDQTLYDKTALTVVN